MRGARCAIPAAALAAFSHSHGMVPPQILLHPSLSCEPLQAETAAGADSLLHSSYLLAGVVCTRANS